jgi:hypothetical protein
MKRSAPWFGWAPARSHAAARRRHYYADPFWPAVNLLLAGISAAAMAAFILVGL